MFFRENSNLLEVQGRKTGTINTIAKVDRSNLEPLIRVLIDIQPVYVYWKFCPVIDNNQYLKNVFAKSYTLLQHQTHPSCLDKYHAIMRITDSGVNIRGQFTSDIPAESPTKMFEYYFETPIEAMWRTLIADVWKDQHPAPINVGFAFADFLIVGMRLLLSQLQKIKAGQMEEVTDGVTDTESTYLNDPADSKANTDEKCDKVWIERVKLLMNSTPGKNCGYICINR